MEENIINSLVGFKSQFKGNVTLTGDFRIDGDFIGKVSSKGKVYISDTGRVKGDISAQYVIVAGAFDGNIYSNFCLLKNTSVALGYINSDYLEVEIGAMLSMGLLVKNKDNNEIVKEKPSQQLTKDDNL